MPEKSYADALSQEGRNLSRLALDRKIVAPAYREQQVASIIASRKRKRSVLLVGEVGVGKTTILHGVAVELSHNKRELWELAATSMLTGTHYLGEWQSKVGAIIEKLKSKNGVLYFSDVWNVLTIGTSSNDPSSLFALVKCRP
jgi:ATP-dependent Clp protease ATP-binding subunit ClpA